MELGEYLGILRKRWIVIAVLTILGGRARLRRDREGRPAVPVHGHGVPDDLAGRHDLGAQPGRGYTSNLMETYALLATTPVVLDPVIEPARARDHQRQVAGTLAPDATSRSTATSSTSAASNASPARAADIANAVAHQLGIAVDELSPTPAAGQPRSR